MRATARAILGLTILVLECPTCASEARRACRSRGECPTCASEARRSAK
jgi:hypothetical protein